MCNSKDSDLLPETRSKWLSRSARVATECLGLRVKRPKGVESGKKHVVFLPGYKSEQLASCFNFVLLLIDLLLSVVNEHDRCSDQQPPHYSNDKIDRRVYEVAPGGIPQPEEKERSCCLYSVDDPVIHFHELPHFLGLTRRR